MAGLSAYIKYVRSSAECPQVAASVAHQRLCVLSLVYRSDLVLSADVPHCERDVLVLDGLHVEADGGDGGHHLAQLQLVQNGRLAGGVQTHHQYTHLRLAEAQRQHTTWKRDE